MTQSLQLQLLGTFTLKQGGEVLTSLSQRERIQSLLGYVILNRGQEVPRSTLAFQLWPESTDSQALTNLRRELYYLKRDFNNLNAYLVVGKKTLCWNPSSPCEIDVELFENALENFRLASAGQPTTDAVGGTEGVTENRQALEVAARFYKGRLLPHLYDEWLLPEQERLQQSAMGGLTALISLLKADGDYRAAIAYAQQLLRLDNLNEAAHSSLIELHALSGDRATALRLYHHCLTLFLEELGVEPSAQLKALYERLLNEPEVNESEANNPGAASKVEPLSGTESSATVEAQSPQPIAGEHRPGATASPGASQTRTDWGEATDVSAFYGRQSELATLSDWVVGDRCRLVAILGMGGMGKTTLSVKFAQQLSEAGESDLPAEPNFDVVIWRSLRYAPRWESLAADLLSSLSNQAETEPSSARLMHWLRESRCLIVLDNVETILQGGEEAGRCRAGYEGYGDLFRLFAEGAHQSCLVITSREKPEAVAMGEGMDLPVRSLPLRGSPEVAEALIQTKGLFGTAEQKKSLGDRYDNMPLAIRIIASSIQELFDGEIEPFLAEEPFMASGLRRLLDQQFERLSRLEQSIMDWLAINHEWTSVQELADDLMPPVPRNAVLSALESLRWRSLIDKQVLREAKQGLGRRRTTRYTQPPAVMEYVTDTLVKRVVNGLTNGAFLSCDAEEAASILRQLPIHSHALFKATAQDYVRELQRGLLMQPIMQQLSAQQGGQAGMIKLAQAWLERLRSVASSMPSYAGGNWLNGLATAQISLDGWDFSGLDLRQAYVPMVPLHRVNFSQSQLERVVFATTLSAILDLDWSGDARFLATADVEGSIRLWQASDGQLLRTFRGHNNWIHCVAFSPCGTGQLRAGTDEPEEPGKTESPWIASGGEDATIRLWEVSGDDSVDEGATDLVLEGHESRVWSVAFQPASSDSSVPELLASTSEDGSVRLWDWRSKTCLQVLQGHQAGVNAVAWLDSKYLVSGGADKMLRLWSNQGDCLGILAGHECGIWAIATHPLTTPSGSATLLASGSQDGVIRLWLLPDLEHAPAEQIEAITCFATLKTPSRWIWSLRFGADGRYLASGHDDGCIYLWETGGILETLAKDGPTTAMQKQLQGQVQLLQGHQSRVWGLAFDPSGQRLVSGSKDQTLRFWDMARQASVKTLRGYTNWVQAIAFHPTGESILAAYEDTHLRQWSLAADRDIANEQTGSHLKVLQGHQQPVWAIALSPDGQHCASAGEDSTVRLWDLAKGRSTVLPGKQGRVWSVDFDSQGRSLAFGHGDHSIVIWDLEQQQVLHRLEGHGDRIWSVAFSPDGETLASSSSDGSVRLWSIESGDCLQTLMGHRGWVFCVCWHPDGKTLASSGSDGAILLWDVAAGTRLTKLQSKTQLILSVQFSPDGQMLASGSDDYMVRLWQWPLDVADDNKNNEKTQLQDCSAIYQGHRGWVWSVAFSPDGKTLASGSQDSTIRLWDCLSGKPLRTFRPTRLYEGLDLTGATGLTPGQQETLAHLGGITA